MSTEKPTLTAPLDECPNTLGVGFCAGVAVTAIQPNSRICRLLMVAYWFNVHTRVTGKDQKRIAATLSASEADS